MSSSGTPESWISSFCSCLGHEYFAEVTEEFIEDDFNLTGLQTQVPMYKEALEMILDVEPEEDDFDAETTEEEEDEEDDNDEMAMRDENGNKIVPYRGSERKSIRQLENMAVIESSAELLYGLIHQRYITSRTGIQQMAEKYESQHFGGCPRVFCNSARVLPVGCSDTPGQDTVKLFCPSCLDIYTPPNSRFQSVDGAFFGTTFGYLFFMTFPDIDIVPKGDPLNLSSTHPAFALPGASSYNDGKSDLNDPSQESSQKDLPRKTSRSSSLTSTPVTATAGFPPPNNPLPGPSTNNSSSNNNISHLPPQPASLNGVTTTNIAPGIGDGKIHEPKIYGFRVSERSKTGPRMKWLRMRPRDMNELDETRRFYTGRDSGGGFDDDYDDADEDGEDVDDARPDDPNAVSIPAPAAATAEKAGLGDSISKRKKAAVKSRRRGPGPASIQSGGTAGVVGGLPSGGQGAGAGGVIVDNEMDAEADVPSLSTVQTDTVMNGGGGGEG